MIEEEVFVTATELNYFALCPRKLWLFRHGIRPESEDVNVQLGKLLHEASFRRDDKDIAISDTCVVDRIDLADGIVHETKKGRTPCGGDILQVQYYLFLLYKRGLRVTAGKIHYPQLRKTLDVPWSDEIPEKIMSLLEDCRRIAVRPAVPEFVRKPYCPKCAYWEYCAV